MIGLGIPDASLSAMIGSWMTKDFLLWLMVRTRQFGSSSSMSWEFVGFPWFAHGIPRKSPESDCLRALMMIRSLLGCSLYGSCFAQHLLFVFDDGWWKLILSWKVIDGFVWASASCSEILHVFGWLGSSWLEACPGWLSDLPVSDSTSSSDKHSLGFQLTLATS